MIVRLLFIFLFFSFTSYSQLVFEQTTVDFGDVTNDSEKYFDIKITNKGNKKEYILNYQSPREVSCLFNTQAALKDSILIFRVQPNPKKTGNFSYKIPIYTSDKMEPTIIHVKGNLTEDLYDPLARLQACPDFTAKPSIHATDFRLTIEVVDSETKEKIPDVSVFIIQNGVAQQNWKTNEQGKIVMEVPIGFAYFYASKEGYSSDEKGTHVTISNSKIQLELTKIKQENPTTSSDTLLAINKATNTISKNENITIDNLEYRLWTENKINNPTEHPILKEQTYSNFDTRIYKPVNVVFVLDISSSMRIGDRTELMKYALLQLTSILRKEDKIGLVSYATETDVLLESISGEEKIKIQETIGNLKLGGSTAGKEGIKLGCKEAARAWNGEGKNLVIIITDGAFNKDSKNFIASIEKYRKQGISISVVGIQNNESGEKNMREVAELGGGKYYSIQKLADAQVVLVDAIKKECAR